MEKSKRLLLKSKRSARRRLPRIQSGDQIDYRNMSLISQFIIEQGKILSRRVNSMTLLKKSARRSLPRIQSGDQIDYINMSLISQFISEQGKILSRRLNSMNLVKKTTTVSYGKLLFHPTAEFTGRYEFPMGNAYSIRKYICRTSFAEENNPNQNDEIIEEYSIHWGYQSDDEQDDETVDVVYEDEYSYDEEDLDAEIGDETQNDSFFGSFFGIYLLVIYHTRPNNSFFFSYFCGIYEIKLLDILLDILLGTFDPEKMPITGFCGFYDSEKDIEEESTEEEENKITYEKKDDEELDCKIVIVRKEKLIHWKEGNDWKYKIRVSFIHRYVCRRKK